MRDNGGSINLLTYPDTHMIGTPCKAPCGHKECATARQMAERHCQYCGERLGFGAKVTGLPPAHLRCAQQAALSRPSSVAHVSLKVSGDIEIRDAKSPARGDADDSSPRPFPRCVQVGELSEDAGHPASSRAWEAFQSDEELKRACRISPREMEMLEQVALMGEVHSPRDFVYVLSVLRTVLKR